MESIFTIYQDLRKQPQISDDSYIIANLPLIKNHKIGITSSGQPMFFIRCNEDRKAITLDTNLEFISVQFNRQCQLINQSGKVEHGIYTIIILKSDTQHLLEYFLKVVNILVNNISEVPLLKDLKIEVQRLVNLFSTFSKPPLKTVQGLWAELLVIEQSKKPEYLIQSWHSSIFDKYDFNDGNDKIEVKSTAKHRRIHSFALEQLRPNPGSDLYVVSIFAIEVGTGSNIFDLMEKIDIKLKNKELTFRMNEIVAATLGKDFEKSHETFFDYQFAADSIQYYNSNDIPVIDTTLIPSSISNVKFDCDLTNVKPIIEGNIESKLHNSLL